jgi:MFS family permease
MTERFRQARAKARRGGPAGPVTARLPRDIKVMLAAAFLIALGFGLVAPVLPQFATTFDVGATAAAVIVSIFAFMRLIFAPAGGALVVRMGERPVYVAGLLIVAASTAACAFAQNYWQLLIFRGLGGAGSVMFTVASMALVVRLAPPESRGRVSGAYAAAFLIGNVCGPIVGGMLAGFGLRVPFLAYAASLVLAALVVQTQLSHVPGASRKDDGKAPAMNLREALHDSAYRAGLFSSFANGWATFGVRMATVPLFAVTALGAGPGAAGWALAVFAGGNAAALTISGKLADNLGRRPMMIAGLTLTGAATAGIGLTHAMPLFLAASAAAGIGSGLLGPAQQAAIADVIGSGRSGGRVLAVFQMMSDTGAIVGPVFAGLLADRLGYGWAFGFTGGVLIVAATGWLMARETLPRAARAESAAAPSGPASTDPAADDPGPPRS